MDELERADRRRRDELVARISQTITDPLLRVIAASISAISAGAGATQVASERVAAALGVLAFLCVIGVVVSLVASTSFQNSDQEGNQFEKVRDDDAKRRKAAQYEKELRKRLREVRSMPGSSPDLQAQLVGQLEFIRTYVSGCSRDGAGLLIVLVLDGDACQVRYASGAFDTQVLRNHEGSLDDLVAELAPDSPTGRVYRAHMLIEGRSHRLVAVSNSNSALGSYVESQIERAATFFEGYANSLSARASGADRRIGEAQ